MSLVSYRPGSREILFSRSPSSAANAAGVYIISTTQVDSPILLDPDSPAAGYGDQAVMAGFATFDDWLVCNCECTCSLPVALSAKVAIRNMTNRAWIRRCR
ncbi:MAG: hypothetical protein FJ276_36800 [Planctomycetes bacterium]|nr:hypothetical protein [Planctomycetota bacterium]